MPLLENILDADAAARNFKCNILKGNQAGRGHLEIAKTAAAPSTPDR